jgi:hypothetical protein
MHGFHFSNGDIKWSFAGVSANALCGGMVYAALDFFLTGRKIPDDRLAPIEGRPLHKLIYDRQWDAHRSTGAQFVGSWLPIIGPLVADTSGVNLGLEYSKLQSYLTKRPVAICLTGGGAGHHLVATACRPGKSVEIEVYDPNYPDENVTLTEVPGKGYVSSVDAAVHRGFFVDDHYVTVKPPPLHEEGNWRLCGKCKGLFFNGHPTNGACPSKGAHEVANNDIYYLTLGSGAGEGNWRWCFQCQALFWHGDTSDPGFCPASVYHNPMRSGEYFLRTDNPHGQSGWQWCSSCKGLFHTGAIGKCASGRAHDFTHPANYRLLRQ